MCEAGGDCRTKVSDKLRKKENAPGSCSSLDGAEDSTGSVYPRICVEGNRRYRHLLQLYVRYAWAGCRHISRRRSPAQPYRHTERTRKNQKRIVTGKEPVQKIQIGFIKFKLGSKKIQIGFKKIQIGFKKIQIGFMKKDAAKSRPGRLGRFQYVLALPACFQRASCWLPARFLRASCSEESESNQS